jgi:uncharacterized membrane protein YphA (DoxX/SURF4 family)
MSGDGAVRSSAWGGASVVLRLQLGAVFLFSSWMKLRPRQGDYSLSGPEDFLNAIKGFRLGLPEWLMRLTAGTVPWTELACAVCLVAGFWTRAAGALAAAMLTVFTALVVSALLRDLNINCGCFGDRGLVCAKAMGWCKVVENLAMLAAAGVIAATARHPASVDSLLERR